MSGRTHWRVVVVCGVGFGLVVVVMCRRCVPVAPGSGLRASLGRALVRDFMGLLRAVGLGEVGSSVSITISF